MSKFVHIFPLSIYRDRITLRDSYKRELIQLILDMESRAEQADQGSDSAWLGDTRGFEFLFQREEFAEIYRQIAEKVTAYTDALGFNNELIDFYFQISQ